MLLVSLIVVTGFSMLGAMAKGPFNFRGSCILSHMHNMIQLVKCDGSQIMNTPDILLDSRTTASVIEMDLTNFQNVTLDPSVRVMKIKIRNTKNVSLYLSNPKLKEIVIESVEVLTLKNQKTNDSIKLDKIVVHNVNDLRLINEGGGKFLWPVDEVKISDVSDFALESIKLHIDAVNVNVENTKIRLRDTSSLLLEARYANMNYGEVYIHEDGYFGIKANNVSVADAQITLEIGTLQILDSTNVVISRNSLYCIEENSLSLHGSSNVKFENNLIFSNDFVDLISSKNKFIFINNSFGCTDCNMKDKLLAVDLKDVGDVNYCYTYCDLTLNKYKELLHDYCVCNNGESTVNESLCAPCSLVQEMLNITEIHNRNFWETITSFNFVPLIIFVVLILFILCSALYFLCYKNKTGYVPRKLENNYGDSQAIIYRTS